MLHHNAFSFVNQVNVTDRVNKSSVIKNKQRSTTVFEEILLGFHHHIARLAWLIPEHLFLVKK